MPLRAIFAVCIAAGTSASRRSPINTTVLERPGRNNSLALAKANAVNGRSRKTQAPDVRHGTELGMLMLAIITAVISGSGPKNIAAQAQITRSLSASQQHAAAPSDSIGIHSRFLTSEPAGLRMKAV
jgi:hypothetical protein